MRIASYLCVCLAACASVGQPTVRPQPSRPLHAAGVIRSLAPTGTIGPTVPSRPAPDPPDLFVAVPRLVSGLNRMRAAQGSSCLRVDAALSVVAEHAAQNVARLGRGAEQRVVDDVTSQLTRFALVFRRVAAAVLFTDQLDDALTSLGPGLDPGMRYAGVAVEPVRSYGTQYAVVVVVGQ